MAARIGNSGDFSGARIGSCDDEEKCRDPHCEAEETPVRREGVCSGQAGHRAAPQAAGAFS